MKVDELVSRQSLSESTHIVHPEDLIFTQGTTGAERAIAALESMTQGKELTTIKWDGFPALVFGRNVDGVLQVMDKHMFTKKGNEGRMVTSPEAFRQYDAARGADRSDLYSKIDMVWSALEMIIPARFRGFYWGDLLYAGRLQPNNGFYTFKPNTVTYKVKANSETGKHIANSVAGIAVHSFFPGVGESDQPLNGLGGLPNNGPIWFVSGEMPVPRVTLDKTAVNTANQTLAQNKQAVDDFMGQLSVMKSRSVLSALGTYINSRIMGGNFDHMLEGFYQYLPTKLSGPAQARLLGEDGWLTGEGAAGLRGIFAIWVAVYNLKLNIKKQIDSQANTGDVQAFTGNETGHEGYVIGGGDEKMKLIDRLGFSRANFSKNG